MIENKKQKALEAIAKVEFCQQNCMSLYPYCRHIKCPRDIKAIYKQDLNDEDSWIRGKANAILNLPELRDYYKWLLKEKK